MLVVVVGAATIKVCFCTAFEAVSGGGDGYFCTVPTLHRRRRWIVAGGGEAGGGGMVPGGWRGGGSWQAIPPFAPIWLGRYVGLVSRNFFLSLGSPRSAVLADSDCVSCCVCVDTEEVDK